jgi:hypothetical protein
VIAMYTLREREGFDVNRYRFYSYYVESIHTTIYVMYLEK